MTPHPHLTLKTEVEDGAEVEVENLKNAALGCDPVEIKSCYFIRDLNQIY